MDQTNKIITIDRNNNNIIINPNPNQTNAGPSMIYIPNPNVINQAIPGQNVNYYLHVPNLSNIPNQRKPKFNSKYQKTHYVLSIWIIIIGFLIMLIDPLLTAFHYYIVSFVIEGFFMIIGGMAGIHGKWNNNRCCLIASLVMYCLAILGSFCGFFVFVSARENVFIYSYFMGILGLISIIIHLIIISVDFCKQ